MAGVETICEGVFDLLSASTAAAVLGLVSADLESCLSQEDFAETPQPPGHWIV